MNLGFTEILLIGGIVLLLFGPSRLPGLGKSVGEAIRGFKKGLSGDDARDVTPESEKLHSSGPTMKTEAAKTKEEAKKT